MKPRIREWLRRYLPAESLSLLATLGAAAAVWATAGSRTGAALVGTWAGNVAYFGWIVAADVWRTRRALHQQGRPYSRRVFLRIIRALVVEFGVAELADSFLIRPALLYYLPLWLGNFALGVVLAKFAADVTFYVPAIIGYELSKKRLRDF